ncbi:MAG: hypothetical protein K2J67_01770 [Lachnospiraceae bacterium]|nr:hypothetical protein [Lachnospiraceae bacterium]
MSKKMEELLYDSLKPIDEPDPEVNRRILEWRSKESMRKISFRKSVVAAAVVCVVAVSSITAVAAYRYLKPSEIAEEMAENDALAKAFDSQDAVKINETQRNDTYEVTLLGMVSGAGLELFMPEDSEDTLQQDYTYVVMAVAHTDGTAVTQDDQKCISPLIHGVDWMIANNGTLNTGLTWFIKDGVMYEMIECDSLEKFAGRGVQIGVVDSFAEENQAFAMDESGKYQQKADYEGTNFLFDLPLDPSKGDEQAAEQYLKELEEELDSEDESDAEEDIDDTEDPEITEFQKLERRYRNKDDEAGFLRKYAEVIPGTRQVLKVDKEGYVHYEVKDSSGDSSEGSFLAEEIQLEAGKQAIIGGGWGETLDSMRLDVITKTEDGTLIFEEYRPAQK